MDKDLKIKPLTKEQIIISLDRLTRFKPTDEKYLRVFSEIISSNLIEPKLKKEDILSMPDMTNIINKIFDVTLKHLNILPANDYSVNKKLFEYETKVFAQDSRTENLLNNKIDYKALQAIITDDMPGNLRWLKHILEPDCREKYSTKFPIEKVVLVEGITEEILLPKFAKEFGFDFDKNGITVIPAGGKNQSVKTFYALADKLKLPMFVLFDKDAGENAKELTPKLRKHDKIHILECGEFEDTLALNHIKRSLNEIFKNYYKFSLSQLRRDLPMTKTLDLVFKECNSEFKKADFAHALSKTIKKEDLTEHIKNILIALQNG